MLDLLMWLGFMLGYLFFILALALFLIAVILFAVLGIWLLIEKFFIKDDGI